MLDFSAEVYVAPRIFQFPLSGSRGRIFPRRSRRRRAFLSIPSLGITVSRGTLMAYAELYAFNSLSRDHMNSE